MSQQWAVLEYAHQIRPDRQNRLINMDAFELFHKVNTAGIQEVKTHSDFWHNFAHYFKLFSWELSWIIFQF